jgi:hypothetical protein
VISLWVRFEEASLPTGMLAKGCLQFPVDLKPLVNNFAVVWWILDV